MKVGDGGLGGESEWSINRQVYRRIGVSVCT